VPFLLQPIGIVRLNPLPRRIVHISKLESLPKTGLSKIGSILLCVPRLMATSAGVMDQAELRRHIIDIQTDTSLDDEAKAQKRQALLSGKWQPQEGPPERPKGGHNVLRLFH
jgi:hypothetical protein